VKLLSKIDSTLNKIETTILIALFIGMLLMAFLQVILRNFFSGGIIWGDILLRHLVLWIGFLGAALATSNERHLNIEILKRFLSEKQRYFVSALTNLFAALICYLLFKASLTFIQFEIANENVIYANIPSWIAEVIIPVGYVMLVIHFIIRILIDIEKAHTNKDRA